MSADTIMTEASQPPEHSSDDEIEAELEWLREPLLKKQQMTETELARPFHPYKKSTEDAAMTDAQGDDPATLLKPELGSLHRRRTKASPQKFDKGRFELLPLLTRPHLAQDIPSTGLTAGLYGLHMTTHHQNATIFRPPFSLLERLCDSHDILLYLISFLTIPDILNLYAMSKRFHFLWNANYVAHVRASLRTWAPHAERIFPWVCYKNLCIKDPYVRQKSKWEGKEHLLKVPYEDKRDVPSLRWLQMVVYREGVTYDMLIQMAMQGLRCPPKTSHVVKRLWFLLDLPRNSHRIALMRSRTYIDNWTLHRMVGFVMKVEMFFTNPFGQAYPWTHGNTRLNPPEWGGQIYTGTEFVEYMFAEKSLTPLWRAIRGWSPDPDDPQVPMTRLDMLRLWARHKFHFPDDMLEPIKKMSFLGVPWWQLGTARLERTGLLAHQYGSNSSVATVAPILPIGEAPLAPMLAATPSQHKPDFLRGPAELLVYESIRRQMKLHDNLLLQMAWGFHDGLGRMVSFPTEEELIRAIFEGKPASAR